MIRLCNRIALSMFLLFCASHAIAAPPVDIPTDQLIIKWKATSNEKNNAGNNAAQRLQQLEQRLGISINGARKLGDSFEVFQLPSRMPIHVAEQVSRRLMNESDIESVEPDRIMQPQAVPGDSFYGLHQWHYKSYASEIGGANLPSAWDISTGNSNVVIAVLDTGILPNHFDLSGRTLPGYDFVNNTLMANDGNGRDSDATDPGDWVTTEEAAGAFSGCPVRNSSWHGSHVAGTIVAAANNTGGVGINWVSKVVPVRVLGKCGGYTSDIIDGMRWAAGLTVTGVSANPNPADIINMSLGGSGSCSSAYQTAINEVVAAGSTIIVAAGNSNMDAANFMPASCTNIVTVASNGRHGGRAYYSNFGASVDITAPGGDMLTSGYDGVYSTINNGTTTASGSDVYAFFHGTSMAAPHVAGVASLMQSAYYALTSNYLTPAQVSAKLTGSARIFPTSTVRDCNTNDCGAGILDAHNALLAVTTKPTAKAGNDQSVSANTLVTLSDSSSTDDHSIASYQWTQVSGTSVTLTNANTASASFTSPSTAGNLEFQLTVTDDIGLTHSDNITINVTAPNNTAPVAQNASIATDEDTVYTGTLNATDADNNNLVYSIVSAPVLGNVTITNTLTGAFSYTPTSNSNGSASFTYRVFDGQAYSNTATISITINAVNDAPNANALSFTTSEDVILNGQLTGSDVENSTLSFALVSNVSQGSLSLTPSDGTFSYTPNAHSNGTDSFSYRVFDGELYSAPANASISITAVNDAPIAYNGNQSAQEDISFTSTLSGSDIDNDTLTFAIVTPPAHGNISNFNATTGNFSYTPNSNYYGEDSFTFTVNDGLLTSDTANFSINITSLNDRPTANPLTLTTNEDMALSSTLSGSDVENSALTFIITKQPTYGSLNVDTTNGEFTYIPIANYFGNDDFSYLTNDGLLNSTPASVNITVQAVDDIPISANHTYTLSEDTTVSGLLSATDIDSNNLSYVLVNNVANGTLELNEASGSFIYRPNANYTGQDSFSYSAFDGTSYSNTASVSLSITPVNDAPITQELQLNLNEDSNVNAQLNATDADNDSLTYSLISHPSKGTLNSINASTGSFIYSANLNANGNDRFTYSVTDGVATTTSSVIINIAAVNDEPIINIPSTNGIILIVGKSIQLDINLQDPDIITNNDQLQVSHSDFTLGNINISQGILSIEALSAGQQTLTLTATDNQGASSQISFVVTINDIQITDSNQDGISDQQAIELGLDTTANSGDSDGDNIADALEIGDPLNPTDNDNDNVIDALEQGDMAFNQKVIAFKINEEVATKIKAPTLANKSVTLSTDSGVRLISHSSSNTGLPLHSIDEAAQPDISHDYPYGIYDFSVEVNTATTKITLSYPAEVILNQYTRLRKLDNTGRWQDFYNFTIDAQNNAVILTLEDNDIFDLDPTVGIIRDPVGIAVSKPQTFDLEPINNTSSSSGGGGGGLLGYLLLLLLTGRIYLRRR